MALSKDIWSIHETHRKSSCVFDLVYNDMKESDSLVTRVGLELRLVEIGRRR